MKTVGIAMLFGLCCMIGVRLGAKKTARLEEIRSIRSDLQMLSERFAAGGGTLREIAGELNGKLSVILHIYLDLLGAGSGEANAAEQAISGLCCSGSEQAGIRMFLTGLSSAARSDLIARTRLLSSVLERAEAEAETEAKQARVLRISGVLTGAGLAILLM